MQNSLFTSEQMRGSGQLDMVALIQQQEELTRSIEADLNSYDHVILAFSGGKDSTACLLHLFELGVDRSKIELWHHLIDGKEGSTLMDWACTEDYCRKVASAFDLPIFYSWKEGGFEREMNRLNSPTSRNHWEYPEDNLIECGLSGGKGPDNTRQKFPQVSANLSVRWCSAYLKIDVCTAAITNQSRFHNKRTLVITGERAEESTSRAKYHTFEPDRADRRNGKSKRHVDHWRPVHAWTETQVWDIIGKYKVNPHPAYKLGWGRLSCMKCIFGSKNQWASVQHIDQKGFDRIAEYEQDFGTTIHRTKSVVEQATTGKVFKACVNGLSAELIKAGTQTEYNDPIFVDTWELPSGAFGDSAGPS